MANGLASRLYLFFAVLMLVNGAVDLFQPTNLKEAMEALSLPHYMLIILGVGKIVGAVILLFAPFPLLKEWAFAGFFVWAIGGLSAHVFSGHAFVEMIPLIILSSILTLSYVLRFRLRLN